MACLYSAQGTYACPTSDARAAAAGFNVERFESAPEPPPSSGTAAPPLQHCPPNNTAKACDAAPNCEWANGTCVPACKSIGSQEACDFHAGCEWSKESNSCSTDCSRFSGQADCGAYPAQCSWDPASKSCGAKKA